MPVLSKMRVARPVVLASCLVCAGCAGRPPTAVDSGDVAESAQAAASGKLASDFSAARIVDLTHPFDEQTIYWPTEDGFQLLRGPAGFTERGYYYAANRFAAAEHGGTHLDAPIHFFQGRNTVDEIPLARLIGEGVVIDVSQFCRDAADYQIGVEDLHRWEERQQRTLVDVIVLLRTGWSAFWPDRERYLGTGERGADAVQQLHFPGLHPDAARWLVDHRAVQAIGIDTPSIDFGQSQDFGSHVRLFEHNVPVFENVAGLDQLPETGFRVIALPMKIAGGSGAPLRIVALLPDQGVSSQGVSSRTTTELP